MMIQDSICQLSAFDISRGLSGPGVITLDPKCAGMVRPDPVPRLPRSGKGGYALQLRRATDADIPAIASLMAAAIGELQRGFLNEAQIEASRELMGLDRLLIDDGTYFIVHTDGVIGGCGGWSRRATLYGGSHSPGRDPALLNPATDAARVRAMYTHPSLARRGIGRLILQSCEDAALAEGFARVELAATLAGLPLYRACGYSEIERFEDERGGVPVPLVRMGKLLGWQH